MCMFENDCSDEHKGKRNICNFMNTGEKPPYCFKGYPSQPQEPGELLPEGLAKLFHDNYERLAPLYGYKTRDESAVDWKDVPSNNKNLMIATCRAVLDKILTK